MLFYTVIFQFFPWRNGVYLSLIVFVWSVTSLPKWWQAENKWVPNLDSGRACPLPFLLLKPYSVVIWTDLIWLSGRKKTTWSRNKASTNCGSAASVSCVHLISGQHLPSWLNNCKALINCGFKPKGFAVLVNWFEWKSTQKRRNYWNLTVIHHERLRMSVM